MTGMKGELLLCGLGPRPPQQTTLQVLRALESCDAVYGPPLAPFLKTRPLRSLAEAVKKARTARIGVGLAGHPVDAGAQAAELERLAREAGVPVRLLPGMTPFGAGLAAEKRPLGWRRR